MKIKDKTLIYLDAGIVNSVGHNLETVRHLAKACPKNYAFEVWAGAGYKADVSDLNIKPCLPYGSPHWPQKSKAYLQAEYFQKMSRLKLFSQKLMKIRQQETRKAIQFAEPKQSADYIINSVELDDAIFQAEAILEKDNTSRVNVILHYSPFHHNATGLRPHVAFAIQHYKSIIAKNRANFANLRFFADTAVLCDVYTALLACEVKAIPIPHLHRANAIKKSGAGKPATKDSNVHVGFFGVYTETKSPHLLAEAIPALVNEKHINWSIAITFLARNKTVDSFSRQMHSMKPLVDYQEGPFDSDFVDKLFEQVDIFVAPYHSHDYEIQSSGVVMEAISSGAIPIVSKSMVDAATLSKVSPYLTMRPNNAQDLTECLRHVASNVDFFKEALSPIKDEIRAFHNPKNFFETLTASKK